MNWEFFVNEHYAPVFRYCCHFLGNRAEAEDAVQQAFLKAFKNFDSLKNVSSAKAWIYSIARNACIDKKRWWKLHFAALEKFHPEASVPQFQELSLTLRKLIDDLPQKQKEVFILRHWHDFSTREAAHILGIDEGTVKSHLKRAVDKLKGALQAIERDGDVTTNAEGMAS